MDICTVLYCGTAVATAASSSICKSPSNIPRKRRSIPVPISSRLLRPFFRSRQYSYARYLISLHPLPGTLPPRIAGPAKLVDMTEELGKAAQTNYLIITD